MQRKLIRALPFSALTLALLTAATGWITSASAADIALTLPGYRWEKPVVTYWINSAGGVSDAAVQDVVTAIHDWNAVLSVVPGAPSLEAASSRKKSDIHFDLRVRQTRNVFGGTIPLQGGYWGLPETDGCVLEKQSFSLQGDVLGHSVGYPQTRNLARHLVGHALGLGDLACPDGALACPSDVMRHVAVWSLIADLDLAISACDVEGLVVLYSAQNCEQIPASIDYTCE